MATLRSASRLAKPARSAAAPQKLQAIGLESAADVEPSDEGLISLVCQGNTQTSGLLFRRLHPDSSSDSVADPQGCGSRRSGSGHVRVDSWLRLGFDSSKASVSIAFARIDPRQKKIPVVRWRTDHDRPIFFIELRDRFVCNWCEMHDGAIVLIPSQVKWPPSTCAIP